MHATRKFPYRQKEDMLHKDLKTQLFLARLPLELPLASILETKPRNPTFKSIRAAQTWPRKAMAKAITVSSKSFELQDRTQRCSVFLTSLRMQVKRTRESWRITRQLTWQSGALLTSWPSMRVVALTSRRPTSVRLNSITCSSISVQLLVILMWMRFKTKRRSHTAY